MPSFSGQEVHGSEFVNKFNWALGRFKIRKGYLKSLV